MGCGASKRSAVLPVDDSAAAAASQHQQQQQQQQRMAPAAEVLALRGEEPPAELLRDRGPLAQPVAFEVPVHEDSLVRKHPPRRLLRLEDQPTVVPLTHSVLDGRQTEAEQRRLQILTQRVQSAKQRAPRRNFLDMDGNSPVDDVIESVKRENSTLEL